MLVSPVFLLSDPCWRRLITSARVFTLTSLTPAQTIRPSRSSRMVICNPDPDRRSMISSLYSSRKERRHSQLDPGPEASRVSSTRSKRVWTVRGMSPVRAVNSAPE